MTTRTWKTIGFNVAMSHGWKDAFVVSVLVIVLGAFVSQISAGPKHPSASQPLASASETVRTVG
jgi:hypothetical protein